MKGKPLKLFRIGFGADFINAGKRKRGKGFKRIAVEPHTDRWIVFADHVTGGKNPVRIRPAGEPVEIHAFEPPGIKRIVPNPHFSIGLVGGIGPSFNIRTEISAESLRIVLLYPLVPAE